MISLKNYWSHIKIYSFEPNLTIFDALKKNSAQFNNWTIFNLVVGRTNGVYNFYYSTKATSSGSFMKDTLLQEYSNEQIRNIKVRVLNFNRTNLKKYNLPRNFDLVKIDTEGFEIEVLKSLTGVNFKYLLIEAPIKSKRSSDIKKICNSLRLRNNKKLNLINIYKVSDGAKVADALFSKIKNLNFV